MCKRDPLKFQRGEVSAEKKTASVLLVSRRCPNELQRSALAFVGGGSLYIGACRARCCTDVRACACGRVSLYTTSLLAQSAVAERSRAEDMAQQEGKNCRTPCARAASPVKQQKVPHTPDT